jgi:regulator of nucleoside diphosphate kinase
MSKHTKPVVTDTDRSRLQTVIAQIREVGHPFRAYVGPLESVLGSATVLPQRAVPANVVTMNSRIRTYDLRTKEEDELTLVYPQESDILTGRMSVLAPLGIAVLGAREGTTLELRVPAGVRSFRIESLLYQPEAAQDYHL